MSTRRLTFTLAERRRLADVCQVLGTTFEEFVHWATMQALDEMEGYARDAALIRAYYENS